VVVLVGETVAVPDNAVPPVTDGEMLKDVAFVVAQVSVELCPAAILVALAVKVTVGAGLLGWVGVEDPPPHAIRPMSRAAETQVPTLRKGRKFMLQALQGNGGTCDSATRGRVVQ
jgi:hypothetical protein